MQAAAGSPRTTAPGTSPARATCARAPRTSTTTAATTAVDAAASSTTDTAGTPANALASFNHNATGGSFKIINGRNLFSSGTRGPNMTNDGLLGGTGTIFANVTNNLGTVSPGASP